MEKQLRDHLDHSMAAAEERRSPFNYLSGLLLVRSTDGQFSLILVGSGRGRMEAERLVSSLSLYWPEYQRPGDDGTFADLRTLPVMLSGEGFSEEDLNRIVGFIGENGKIAHVSGYDHGLVNELNPDFRKSRAELVAWYGQDIQVLVAEMKQMTNGDLVESQNMMAPDSSIEDGFTDFRLRAMVDLIFNKKDVLWGSQNASLYDYVSSRLVGRQGHPLEEEILDRSTATAPTGEPALESIKSAREYFDESRYGMDRAIIFGLGYDLAALLAPQQIRNQMLANILKGSNDNVAQRLIWLGAIRQTVLEFVSQTDEG